MESEEVNDMELEVEEVEVEEVEERGGEGSVEELGVLEANYSIISHSQIAISNIRRKFS